MKKIYMILAAMTLLTMSLNAQRLPANFVGGTDFTPTGKAHLAEPGSMLRMPTLASDQYLLGPYVTDDYDVTGTCYANYYTQGQAITTVVVLDKAEYESHLGDTIIGFRFALTGSSSAVVSDFLTYPYGEAFDNDHVNIWNLGELTAGGNVHIDDSGSGGSTTTSTDVTVGPLNTWTTTRTYTVDGVTLTTTTGDLGYDTYMRLNGTSTISVADGTITKIVINGSNANNPVSNLSTTTGTYTYSNNVGTWTGSASSVAFTSTSYASVTSVVVTVETTSSSSGSVTGTIDVGNGATTSGNFPAYGYMQDVGYRNQMIYTSNQVCLASGSQITSITFYPENGTGIPFYGSTVTLSLGNTTTSYFSGSKITPSDLTAVASKRITAADADATAWTFTFNTPFTYTGGNLLVQVYCQGYNNDGTSGQWARGYFYGDEQNSNVSIYSSGSSASGTTGTNSTFLPKATFGFTGEVSLPQYLELESGWHDFYLDEPVEFQVSSTDNTNLMIGYTYYQEYNTSFNPVALYSGSTGHKHYSYMYAQASGSSSYTQQWWDDGTSGSDNTDRPGDLAVQLIFKESKQKTDAPTITYTQDAAYYHVTATAPASDPNATVTLTVGGQTAIGTGSVTINVGRGDSNQTVTATATAQATDKLVSDPTTETITVEASPLEPSPAPTIDSQVLDATVQVTGTGQGEVHMYIDGQEVTSPYYLERTDEQYSVTVTVTAQINDGDHKMTTTTQTVIVPPLANIDLDGWTQLPGTYNNDQVINWNQYLMFVDRFSVSTANNNHPAKYTYKMTENPTKLITPLRNTNEHIIPVQLTRSRVWGYYTEQEVLDDTLRQIVDTCLMNADVNMNLEQSTEIYYYTLDRSRNSILDDNFLELSYLQNDGARYVEFDHYYTWQEPFQFGTISRFDTINTVLPATAPQGVEGKHYGKYSTDYMAYVPIIWTHGNDPMNKRLKYDTDSLNNSYGSPIWKTAVGKVEVVGAPKLERQQGESGSTNWTEINGNDTTKCSIFMVKDIEVNGFLPDRNVTNIKYEPYMFRVWVVSKRNNLRKFEWVPGEEGRPGSHFEGRGVIPANTPYMIWEEFVADSSQYITFPTTDVTHFHKWKEENPENLADTIWLVPEDMNMIFAGQNDIAAEDIKILVRFYYRSTGEGLYQNAQTGGSSTMFMRNRGTENQYYGVENPGGGDPNPEIPTYINNVYDYTQARGEVVDVTYFNLQGMKSSVPFDGINIVVTRYSNGSVSSTKVLR